jgi:hypothetical protein
MARIVNTDNFCGDYPNEKFILWLMKRETAQRIADALNDEMGPNAARFYKVVENVYVLEPGFEP